MKRPSYGLDAAWVGERKRPRRRSKDCPEEAIGAAPRIQRFRSLCLRKPKGGILFLIHLNKGFGSVGHLYPEFIRSAFRRFDKRLMKNGRGVCPGIPGGDRHVERAVSGDRTQERTRGMGDHEWSKDASAKNANQDRRGPTFPRCFDLRVHYGNVREGQHARATRYSRV